MSRWAQLALAERRRAAATTAYPTRLAGLKAANVGAGLSFTARVRHSPPYRLPAERASGPGPRSRSRRTKRSTDAPLVPRLLHRVARAGVWPPSAGAARSLPSRNSWATSRSHLLSVDLARRRRDPLTNGLGPMRSPRCSLRPGGCSFAAASAKSRVPHGTRVAPVLGRRRSECDSVAPRYATHTRGDHE
jgi:hypothetical protein